MPDRAHRILHPEQLADGSFQEGDVEDELDRLVNDPGFLCTERNKRFLEYVVRETLCNRADRIKAYSIAVDVFGRPANFDPATDPIVRIEATRLRAALSQYYQQCNGNHRLKIELPKGHYVPFFRLTQIHAGQEPGKRASTPFPPDAPRQGSARRALRTAILSFAFALVVAAAGALSWRFIAPPERAIQLERPVLSIAMKAVRNSSPAEIQRFEDALSIALSRFQSLRVESATVRHPVLASKAVTSPASDHLTISVTYRRIGDEASAYWELLDSSRRVLLQAGETRIAHGSGNAPIDALANRLAVRLAADRGIINGILVRRKAGAIPIGSRCFATAFQALEVDSSAMLADAKKCLSATLRQAPSSADAHALLAMVELRTEGGEALAAAIAHSEKAIALEPANYLSQSAYMKAQFRIDHVDAAIAAGRRAIQSNPFDPAAKAQLGSILFRTGKWDESLLLTREAAELDERPSGDSELTFMLDAYRRGAFEEALFIANRTECQDCLVGEIMRAASLARTGRNLDAMNAIAEIRRKHPDFDLVRDLRANGFSDPLIEMIESGIGSADPLSVDPSRARSG